MSKADLHTVGTIVGVHGIRGELRLMPYGDLDGVDWTGALLELGGRSRVRPRENAGEDKNLGEPEFHVQL